MLVQMLIPSELKGQCAKKYYDWAANYEMNALHTYGVDGVRVLVMERPWILRDVASYLGYRLRLKL